MKRAALFLLFVICALSLAAFNEVHAKTWKFQGPEDFGGAIQGEDNNSQSTWFTGLQNMSYGIACMGVGSPCSADSAQTPMFIQKSAVGVLSNVLAATFTTKPADFGLWLADTGHTLGFLPQPVYAQGIGFSGLTPILPIWKAFRNLAYLLMAGVMIVIGFMIMLRKKIDPKTVVTAQNAIPRIIIALILITFSYAIVGLMIDLMYVVLYFFATVFASTKLLDQPVSLYTQGSLWQNMWNIPINPYKILFGWNIDPIVASRISSVIAGVAAIGAIALFPTTVAGGVAAGAGAVVFAAMPLIHVILAVAILFLFIKLVAFFLSAYIQIIISLLLGPLQLLTEAIPGSNGFSSWFKNLVANIAVFPIGGAMFMLADVFVHISNTGTGSMWSPPYSVITTNPSINQVASLISLGLLFAIPSVAGSVKEALKAKSPVPMFDMGGAGGSAMQILSTAYYLKALAPQGLIDRITGKDKKTT